MAVNLRKFVNPRFLRTVDPELLGRLLDRHRHRLIGLDVDVIRSTPECAGEALQEFFAGPEDCYPEGLIADLHRIAELGDAAGLRLILDEARRHGQSIGPERGPGGGERRQDPKHVALRAFLDHPAVFDAASDMLALAARSSLAEYAGLEEGVEVEPRGAGPRDVHGRARRHARGGLCGSYCRLGWYADTDDVNLVISHGSIVKTTPIVRRGEERVVSYRDAEQAVLSYSAATGRLKMGDIPKFRRAGVAELFAERMLGRPGFFAAESAQDLYTLAPIERKGPGFRFHHGFDQGIRQVKIVEAQARRPVEDATDRQRLRCVEAGGAGRASLRAGQARRNHARRAARRGLAAGARRYPHRARCRPRAAGATDRQDQAPGEGRLPAAPPRGPRPQPPAPKRARP